jgi:glutamate--cysteine ligase
MSTHLRRSPTDAPPVAHDDLIAYFEAGAKPVERWRVGAEFEKFALHRETGKQIGFDDGIEGVLQRLAARFGWERHMEADRLTALTHGKSTLSVEPGGQLELSTSPSAHISELKDELDRHLAELRAVTEPGSIAWAAAGVTPFSTIDEIPLNPRPRHRFMAEYLPTRCRYGLHMMKATASTQVTFDYADEADAGRKLAVSLTLSPVINAAFANAPYYAGRGAGFASFRSEIWHGMDPDRSGFLAELLGGEVNFERWTEFVLDVPLLFINRDGRLLPAPGATFRDWMDNGLQERLPTIEDWDIHLSTVFTEVRLKKFLEIRGADAAPTPLAAAVPAVWKGLLYDVGALDEATELARAFPAAEIQPLSQAIARDGLQTVHRGRTVGAWCREAATIAARGLKRIAAESGREDESTFLEPLHQLLASERAPHSHWPVGGTVAEVLACCEYPAER